MSDQGLLLARLAVGLLMAAHGTQKAFGWFGGYGLTGTGGFFESLGFRPGRFFAAAAAYGEIISGLLIAFGLFGAAGPALMLSIMIVAAVSAHLQNGLWAMNNGIEVPLLYGIFAVAFALTGFGAYSVDAIVGLHVFSSPLFVWSALLAGTVGAFANLAQRRATVKA